MTKISFLMMLTPAEKRALKILSAIERVSMADITKREISALWQKHFPHMPLGEIEDKRVVDNKHKHTERE